MFATESGGKCTLLKRVVDGHLLVKKCFDSEGQSTKDISQEQCVGVLLQQPCECCWNWTVGGSRLEISLNPATRM